MHTRINALIAQAQTFTRTGRTVPIDLALALMDEGFHPADIDAL
jgi:hypothetical protein